MGLGDDGRVKAMLKIDNARVVVCWVWIRDVNETWRGNSFFFFFFSNKIQQSLKLFKLEKNYK